LRFIEELKRAMATQEQRPRPSTSASAERRSSQPRQRKSKMSLDKSTFLGIAVAAAGMTAGLYLEGGRIFQILQPTASLIVFGGTIGAVMVQFPFAVVLEAGRSLPLVAFEPSDDTNTVMEQLVEMTSKARRNGIVSLDGDLEEIDEPFFKRALTLAIDGTGPDVIRHIMEVELGSRTEKEEQVPSVYESAGGFAPTIGIIGAVLGLIQVMQHLSNIEEVGRGVAVAFVATLYGVAAANLLFLPAAGKLKTRLRNRQIVREMALEGVLSIVEGLNPRMLESRLLAFRRDHSEKDSRDA
jgi:chemotaxis protein MotA